MFKKVIGVIVPLFNITLCLLMLHSLRLPRFPFLLLFLDGGRMIFFLISSQGENDDLLVYTIASLAPTLAPVLVKPPITQVYSRR